MKDQRSSPLLGQVLLFVAFLVLACVGVATVIVPELSEDPAGAEDGSTANTEEGASDGPSDDPSDDLSDSAEPDE